MPSWYNSPFEKVQEVFDTVGQIVEPADRFITVDADIDIAYKITNALEYENRKN